jgi:integrase
MGVHKRDGSPFWQYKFKIRGIAYRGTTQTTNEREARRIEQRERKAILEKVKSTSARGAPLTFGDACALYWDQVGQFHKGEGAGNTLWSLNWLTDKIGAGRRLADIDNRLVASITAQRRGERGRHGQALAAATVNRSVIEPLRKVLMRARKLGAGVAEIEWRMHLLKEPDERVRELTAAEEAQVFNEVREDYAPLIEFALLTGCRLAECVGLVWSDVDFGARLITIRGKGGRVDRIAMPPAVRDVLFPLQQHHPKHVFTYEAQRTHDRAERGERRPITASGVKTLWRRLRARIELAGYRWHDHRHTAATRLLRVSNLKVVQKTLRHASIETTMRYAHVQNDEIEAAMQRAAEARTAPPTAEAAAIVPLDRKRAGES